MVVVRRSSFPGHEMTLVSEDEHEQPERIKYAHPARFRTRPCPRARRCSRNVGRIRRFSMSLLWSRVPGGQTLAESARQEIALRLSKLSSDPGASVCPDRRRGGGGGRAPREILGDARP